jgi:hypothetical protein
MKTPTQFDSEKLDRVHAQTTNLNKAVVKIETAFEYIKGGINTISTKIDENKKISDDDKKDSDKQIKELGDKVCDAVGGLNEKKLDKALFTKILAGIFAVVCIIATLYALNVERTISSNTDIILLKIEALHNK